MSSRVPLLRAAARPLLASSLFASSSSSDSIHDDKRRKLSGLGQAHSPFVPSPSCSFDLPLDEKKRKQSSGGHVMPFDLPRVKLEGGSDADRGGNRKEIKNDGLHGGDSRKERDEESPPLDNEHLSERGHGNESKPPPSSDRGREPGGEDPPPASRPRDISLDPKCRCHEFMSPCGDVTLRAVDRHDGTHVKERRVSARLLRLARSRYAQTIFDCHCPEGPEHCTGNCHFKEGGTWVLEFETDDPNGLDDFVDYIESVIRKPTLDIDTTDHLSEWASLLEIEELSEVSEESYNDLLMWDSERFWTKTAETAEERQARNALEHEALAMASRIALPAFKYQMHDVFARCYALICNFWRYSHSAAKDYEAQFAIDMLGHMQVNNVEMEKQHRRQLHRIARQDPEDIECEDHCGLIIIATNCVGRVTKWNDQAESVFQMTAEDVVSFLSLVV